jgi:ATP-dependent RNA helicase SUPV3L1/SUV3
MVTVEGFAVGRLAGLAFSPAKGAGALEQKALRQAAERVVAPEVNRRLGALTADPDSAFALSPDGLVLWRGEAAGAIAGGDPFNPSVRLLTELGAAATRERGGRRLEAFVAAEAGRRFAALRRLSRAVSDGAVTGLARGIAWRLAEAGGVIDRRVVETDLAALSRAERRELRRLSVHIDAFCLRLPSQGGADAFAAAFAEHLPAAKLDALAGRLRLGEIAAEVAELEVLAARLRAAPKLKGGRVLAEADLPARTVRLFRALGFNRSGKVGEPQVWRRRRAAARPQVAPHSPFAALAGLENKIPSRRRARRV